MARATWLLLVLALLLLSAPVVNSAGALVHAAIGLRALRFFHLQGVDTFLSLFESFKVVKALKNRD